MFLTVLFTLLLGACSATDRLPENPAAAGPAASIEEPAVDANQKAAAAPGEPVAGLPFSHGKSFRTLDEYLAHLERYAAPIDQPWWREIRPGVYEHVKRMKGAPRETATREQLMQRFRFSR